MLKDLDPLQKDYTLFGTDSKEKSEKKNLLFSKLEDCCSTLLSTYGKEIFLNQVIIISQDTDITKKLRKQFRASYPSSNLYHNINPFKATKNDSFSILGHQNTSSSQRNRTGSFNIKTSSKILFFYFLGQKLNLNLNNLGSSTQATSNSLNNSFSGWNLTLKNQPSSRSITSKQKEEARLSQFFTKDELLAISKDSFTVSKMVHEKLSYSLSNGQIHPFSIFHVYNDIFTDTLIPSTISYIIQNIFKMFGEAGIIEISYKLVLDEIVKDLNTSENYARDLLLRAADLNVLLIQDRNITQLHQLNFVSLKLEILSLENIFWVVKSLKNDRVTPIESTVLGRIKHSFGLKMKAKVWKAYIKKFIEYLKSQKIGKNIF